MNEYMMFEQRSGLGKRGGWTSNGQRITNRQPQIRINRRVEPDIEEDESYDDTYPPRLPTSTRRYNVGYDLSDEEVIEQGNRRLHIRYVDVPKRRQSQLPPASTHQNPRQQDIDED